MITSLWMKPGDDLTAALRIREQVFQQELGLSQAEDQDALDGFPMTALALQSSAESACCRNSAVRALATDW